MRAWLHAAGFAVALVGLISLAHGGPGWGASAATAALSVRLGHSAAAPLYGAIAGIAALLPAGEPGLRLGVLGALLGATTLAGVAAIGRGLLPKVSVAGVVAAVIVALAPPFRDACTAASPSILAAAASAWALAFALRKDARSQLVALALCGVAIGAAPWLGVALAVGLGALAWREQILSPTQLAAAAGALIVWIAVLFAGASGRIPGFAPSLGAALAASGRGAGAVVVGAGLLGIGFGAITGLAGARRVALVAAIALAHEIAIGGSAAALLAILGAGGAILAGAVARAATDKDASPRRREIFAAAAGVPLVLACIATGVAGAPAPGAAPLRLAAALDDELPPGPGIFIATRATGYFALAYEHAVAGARPDLAVALTRDDVIAANALRDHQIVGADVAAFGRLDIRRAMPRGRGFQLLGDPPATASEPPPPAQLSTPTGADEAVALALERAGYEAASGRLDAAARAAGLADRFGAADLAVLAATAVTAARPPTFGFLPNAPDAGDKGERAWLLATFGDDLAWVANIPLPADASAPSSPMPRRLHAKWCELLAVGKDPTSDPNIAAMGPAAVVATADMWQSLHR